MNAKERIGKCGSKPPAGRKTRLVGLGTFDTECRKCFCVTFSKSNKNIPPQTSPLGSSLAGIWVAGEKGGKELRAIWKNKIFVKCKNAAIVLCYDKNKKILETVHSF